jgi:hypothetical protein
MIGRSGIGIAAGIGSVSSIAGEIGIGGRSSSFPSKV